MSSAASPGLLQTIETDLQAGENWLKTEAEATGLALWGIAKAVFLLATSEQAQVILDVFAKVESDATGGKTLEQIETDMLNTATVDELTILKSAGSQVIQGIVAFIQASKAAPAA